MKTKKELKNEYKQLKPSMGVFQIRNSINNKILVDSSIDMLSKWSRHKMELKFRSHRNIALQKDWNEAGESNFVFEILSELKYRDDENVNYKTELKALQEMVVDEIKSKGTLFYS